MYAFTICGCAMSRFPACQFKQKVEQFCCYTFDLLLLTCKLNKNLMVSTDKQWAVLCTRSIFRFSSRFQVICLNWKRLHFNVTWHETNMAIAKQNWRHWLFGKAKFNFFRIQKEANLTTNCRQNPQVVELLKQKRASTPSFWWISIEDY